MWKKLILLSIFFTVYKSYAEVKITNNLYDTSVLSTIMNLPLSSYIGKTVDSLFSALPPGFTDRDFMPVSIGKARGVYQGYISSTDDQCYVEIFINQFSFLSIPILSPTTNWDMNLAKKETIAWIKVWKNNTCVYGENENFISN